MNMSQARTERAANVGENRAYVSPGPHDGYHVLVDRLWPRGVSKSDAGINKWWKERAPSTALRKCFGQDPSKWARFNQQYADELEVIREEVGRLRSSMVPRMSGTTRPSY